MLLLLSSPEAFKGGGPATAGGTGFWHQDAGGHRVELALSRALGRAPPTRGPAGRQCLFYLFCALVFGGHVTYAGMRACQRKEHTV